MNVLPTYYHWWRQQQAAEMSGISKRTFGWWFLQENPEYAFILCINCLTYSQNYKIPSYVSCTMFNLFSGDAGWSLWVSGNCIAPCGQNGTAIATRKCSGPSHCCSGERDLTEVCTSPPCNHHYYGREDWLSLIQNITVAYSVCNFRCCEARMYAHTHTHTHNIHITSQWQNNRKCTKHILSAHLLYRAHYLYTIH